MFSGHVVNDSDEYDFQKNENAVKWKGIFSPALKKVLEQVHPRLSAKDETLQFVEQLCLRLLAMLCAKPPPHTIQDVEERVRKIFPGSIDQWALAEAREIIISKKKKSVLPADRVHSMLQKEVLQYKIDSTVSLFLVAVLEYISADIFKLAGNYVIKIKNFEISREDIEVIMCADKELMEIFHGDKINNVIPSPLPPTPRATTYEEVVKELIHDEKQYQRDLHMIIRVFREELVKIVKDVKELDPIFSNIMDIYELTVTLLGSLEDVIEMSQEQSSPCVGSCFEELAEAAEFEVYSKYAHDVTSQQSRDALTYLLLKPDAMSLMSAAHGFREAVKYYLPKLLLMPIWHAFLYLEYIKKLMSLSSSQEDRESFEQVQGLLKPLQCDLENIVAQLPKESVVRMHSRTRRQLAIERTRELQQTVEHWDKDVGQSCNEFIREDTLVKLISGKRITERKVYLFDGLLVLCKANRRQTVSVGQTNFDFRLKEKFFMRRVEVVDRADTDEHKHLFEISPRVQPAVVLIAKSQQHKNDWMADLIMVNTKSMLDRILDSILLDIEKKHPLRLPSPDIYIFAVPDSSENIVLEEKETAGVPLIKGATLCKLIERLTYHIYADPMFVRTFLTTYRYFCSPQQLLQLLIERFEIPHPSLVYQDNQSQADKDMGCESDKIHKTSQREDWKRYKKEFVQPVQFRVLNALRHWVDHHFYDFEKDPSLLEKLLHFLENINGKPMRKWVDSVLKIVQRKKEQEESHKQITFAFGHSPPAIEHHLQVPETEFNLLTLHPLELARQLTLLEFELYKNVKPSELVGTPWTKKDKETKSPNLLKIMKHTTNVTRWFEKQIIEAENYEERVAMVTRAIEVRMATLELNNFNGTLAISAAMCSASVYRLNLTFQGLPTRYSKFREECREFNDDGHLKKYQKKLRSINPPCVPFFGTYLTNILHLDEGIPDFLPNTELINFSKRRKFAEIIGEIQQYQNQPYCLIIDPKIRHFLETLDPFKGLSDTEISNYLYEESVRIEPKGCKQPLKFSRKWPHLTLKSPGIKPRRQNNSNNNSNINSNKTSFGSKFTSQQIEVEHSPQEASNHSVFANVNIQERNPNHYRTSSGSQILSYQSSSATNPTLLLSNNTEDFNDATSISSSLELAPELPKRCGTGSDMMRPIISPNSGGTLLNNWRYGKHHLIDDINYGTNDANSSPAPSHFSSTSHAGLKDLSPIQNGLPSLEPQGSSNPRNNFSYNISPVYDPNDIYPPSPKERQQFHPNMSGSNVGHLMSDNMQVPVSPHVNVPTTQIGFTNSIPPPLPPRRKEKKDTSSDFQVAQTRQAPDAPLLPPRDGELSPPPVPPRLNQYSGGPIMRQHVEPLEFLGKNSLSSPNTSAIMIRRNSEKGSNSGTSGGCSVTGNVNVISGGVTIRNLRNMEDQYKSNKSNNSAMKDISISPAKSSSLTPSPTTSNTPMATTPHLSSENASISSYTQQNRLRPSCSPNALQASNNRNSKSIGRIPYIIETIPRLPPKPSYSACSSNNQDKTMFPYPSTKHD